MLTLPSSFTTAFTTGLSGGASRAFVVYELALAAGTLRYSSQAVTWGGNAYTPMVIRQSPIDESKDMRVQSVTVTFANCTNELRSQIAPIDLISGRRMTCRLLMRDAAGAVDAGSVVLFVGVMKRPTGINELEVDITVNELLEGYGILIPTRRTTMPCGWRFADGEHCNYSQTTTTSSGGTGTTINVADGSNLRIGEYVTVGSSAVRKILTKPTANSFTVSPSITWSNADPVRYFTCGREHGDCEDRERLHEFGGFLGVDSIQRDKADWLFNGLWGRFLEERPQVPIPRGKGELTDSPLVRTADMHAAAYARRRPAVSIFADPSQSVPVIYGRKFTDGRVIERMVDSSVAPARELAFLLVSEGKIDEIVEWYFEGLKQNDVAGSTQKRIGMHYRIGEPGIDADDTNALLNGAAILRDQNRDFFTRTGTPYSEAAYAVFARKADQDIPLPEFKCDVRGLLVGIYDGAGSYLYDQWSDSAVWQFVDLLHKHYGYGSVFSAADIDLEMAFEVADWCAVPKLSDEANTVVTLDQASPSDEIRVESTQGFVRGMRFYKNGGGDNHITAVLSDTVMTAQTAITQTIGDTIQAVVPRFGHHVILDAPADPMTVARDFLASFDGYRTYADGKLQIRRHGEVVSSSGHFRDIGADPGYGIVDSGFSWLDGEEEQDRDINKVVVEFFSEYLQDRDEDFDADLIHQLTHPIKELRVSIPGVTTRDQAKRLARLFLDRIRGPEVNGVRTPGQHAQLTVGPIGLKLQPGDRIEVTHAVPGWSNVSKLVSRVEKFGLGSPEDGLVRVTVEDYDAAYDPGLNRRFTRRPVFDEPTVTLFVDTSTAGSVRLSWTLNEGFFRVVQSSSIYMRTSAFDSGMPSPDDRIGTVQGGVATFTYVVSDAEVGQTLYFKVRVHSAGNRISGLSNELEVVPEVADPTAGQHLPGANMLAHGDMDHPLDWEAKPTSETPISPPTDASSAESGYDNAFSNRNNARDGDEGTESLGTFTSTATLGSRWWWTVTGTRTGWFEALVRTTNHLRPASVEFSINGGTDWLPMGTASAVTTLKSQVVTCDLSDCIVRSTREESNRPSDTAGIAEIRFVELGAGGYATLGNGVASLRGEVGEAWWIRHPFPGIDPMPGEVVFVEGSEIMVGLDVRHVGVEPTDVIEIVLRDEDTATEWVILSIDPEDVTADWQRAVRPWVSPAVIAGTLFIYIRTESTEGVQVDKAMPSPGAEVRAFARHHGEPGGAPDARTGRVQGFEPGGFPAVKPKFSLLIGGLI